MKKILVTGASRGIGRAIVERLVSCGYYVVGTYNTARDEAEELSRRLEGSIEMHQVDLSIRNETMSFLERISQISLNGIVNNAGMIDFEEFDSFDYSIWDKTVELNTTAPLLISQKLSRNLQPGAVIVNIASTDGMTGTFSSISYAASKAALLSITKALGNVLGRRGVRVVAIAPGWINTGMSTAASIEAADLTPLGRNGRPGDVAGVVCFMLSEEANFVNGACLIVDGGYTNVDSIMLKESQGLI